MEGVEGYLRTGQLIYDLGAFTHVHRDVSRARRKAKRRGISLRHSLTLRACKICVKLEWNRAWVSTEVQVDAVGTNSLAGILD